MRANSKQQQKRSQPLKRNLFIVRSQTNLIMNFIFPFRQSNETQRFEKLDITPKSAQKIKPVLERWMKEAEERYLLSFRHFVTNVKIILGIFPMF